MPYLIKRYANRKLYDVQASRYVTLDALAEMIRTGRELAVVDATSGEDLTAVVLTQVILDRERGGGAGLPTAFLHQLIKHGDAWQQFMARGLYATLEGVIASQREAERIFQTWATRTGLAPSTDSPAPATPRPAPAREVADKREEGAVLKRKLRGLERRRRRGRRTRKRTAGR